MTFFFELNPRMTWSLLSFSMPAAGRPDSTESSSLRRRAASQPPAATATQTGSVSCVPHCTSSLSMLRLFFLALSDADDGDLSITVTSS